MRLLLCEHDVTLIRQHSQKSPSSLSTWSALLLRFVQRAPSHPLHINMHTTNPSVGTGDRNLHFRTTQLRSINKRSFCARSSPNSRRRTCKTQPPSRWLSPCGQRTWWNPAATPAIQSKIAPAVWPSRQPPPKPADWHSERGRMWRRDWETTTRQSASCGNGHKVNRLAPRRSKRRFCVFSHCQQPDGDNQLKHVLV